MIEGRRAFLSKAFALGATGALVPGWMGSALAQETRLSQPENDKLFWSMPRSLFLARKDTGEYSREVYWAEGQMSVSGYERICWMLRDGRENQAVRMDARLLDLLRAMQAWVGAYGYTSPLVIHSGYRTPKTNWKTEGAAKNSLHMQGRAIDFSFPGLPSAYMGQLATRYRGGGVGFYTSGDFTHVDTGQERYWIGGSRKKG